jgi:NDP-sugar pyrophosphorylase family protein
VRQFDVEVPYGVVENEGGRVRAIQEKPTYSFLVNAGIYLLEPSVVSLIPQDHPFNMTDLIERLIKNDRKVTSFPIIEYWLDIGQHEDYRKAQDDVSQGRIPE